MEPPRESEFLGSLAKEGVAVGLGLERLPRDSKEAAAME